MPLYGQNPIFAKLLPSGAGTLISSTATSAISSPAGPVAMSIWGQVNNYSSASITGGGHQVGVFGIVSNAAAGTTNALAIGVEGTIDNTDGTITRANGLLGTLNNNSSGKTITLWTGATGVPTNNSGTLTKAQGFRAEVTSGNTGTITEWNGYYNADASSGVGTITSRFAFVNDDAGAVFKSKAPFCDNSFTALAPTNGGTTSIPAGVGLVVLNSGGTIASTTLAIAAIAGFTDGQKIVFFNVSQITAITWTSAGVTQLGLPAQLLANGFCTLQYAAAGPYWIRVG